MKDKVVLAFSGGLDTSYCASYLTVEKGLEVHSVVINTGGFSDEELKAIEERAYSLGVKEHLAIDEVENFYNQCVRYLIYGNTLRNNTYPLSVSAERIFQAISIAKYAKKINARYIAHGSTGAGNDQVRFDLVFNILCPEIEILTPIRDQELSRETEIEYLRKAGLDLEWKKAKYSINKGLWGTSVGGQETLGSKNTLPNEAYPSQLSKEDEQVISLTFKKGELTGLNDTHYDAPYKAIQDLKEIASAYAIGRDVHVGDTIIGIKGRVGFEAAEALVILKAHHLLEKHTLTKWQLYWKEQLANWYGMFVHEGQFLDPVMRNIEKFLEDTQSTVSGKVFVKLLPFRFELQGIESEFDLMSSKFGSYGEMNKGWTGADVRGFTKILANPLKIHRAVNGKDETGS